MRLNTARIGCVVAAGLLGPVSTLGALAQSASPSASPSSSASTAPSASPSSSTSTAPSASTPAASPSAPSLRPLTIEAISTTVTSSQPLDLRLSIGPGQELRDPRITIAVRKPLTDREELTNAVLNQRTGWLFSSTTERIAPLETGVGTTVSVQRSSADLYLDRFEATGVYPLDISLLDGNRRVARVVTAVVVSPETTAVPVAIVGGLGQTNQSVIVGSHDDLPTQAREVIPTPAYDADLLGLASTNQAALVTQTVTDGLRDRQPSAPMTVPPVIATTGPIDRTTARAIAQAEGLQGMLVPSGSLAQHGSVHTVEHTRVLAGDPSITEAAHALDDAALRQWMAAFTLLPDRDPTAEPPEDSASERESKPAPTPTTPSPVLLDLRAITDAQDQQVLSEALDGLPWVNLGSIGTLMTAPVPEGNRAVFTSQQISPERRQHLEQIAEARAALPSLLAMTGRRVFEDGTNPQHFDQELLEATSINTSTHPAATKVLTTLRELNDGIQVISPPPITMTGNRGTIPIPVVNDASIPLDVRVRIISSNLVVDGSDTVEMRLRAQDATHKDVVVIPRTSGGLTSAIIQVENPLTGALIASGTISVRSTAYPYTALLFAAGAIGVLALWGWRNRPARWRARPRPDEDLAQEAASPDDTGEVFTTQPLTDPTAPEDPITPEDPTAPLPPTSDEAQ